MNESVIYVYPTNPTTSPGHFLPQIIARGGTLPPMGAKTRILPFSASTSATYTKPMMLASRISRRDALGAACVMAKRVLANVLGAGGWSFVSRIAVLVVPLVLLLLVLVVVVTAGLDDSPGIDEEVELSR